MSLMSDIPPPLLQPSAAALVIALSLGLSGCLDGSSSSSNDAVPPGEPVGPEMPQLDSSRVLPLVFVHGLAGSGSQYQTQAMRFASNDYPQELISAYEYSTASAIAVGAAATGALSGQLDARIDALLAEHGAEQVYLACHSLGTRVCSQYLEDPERAAKVAGYVGIDGVFSETCPGDVPCRGIFVNPERQLGSDTVHLPDETHVQVATSEASFRAQFEFFTGTAPARTQILAQEGELAVEGRAVYFPANSGAEGTTLNVWKIDSDTGARTEGSPVASAVIDTTGAWGPFSLTAGSHYEFQLVRPGRSEHHFYRQPFLRDTNLVRFNTSPLGSEIEQNTNVGNDHATLVITRDMEWWADREQRDVLEVATVSPLWGDEPAFNILRPEMGDNDIGIHVHDDEATPALTTGELLPYFPDQPFQTGVDVNMPATIPPDGVISIVSTPRGDTARKQTLNVPNWASSEHRISIIFNDFVQD